MLSRPWVLLLSDYHCVCPHCSAYSHLPQCSYHYGDHAWHSGPMLMSLRTINVVLLSFARFCINTMISTRCMIVLLCVTIAMASAIAVPIVVTTVVTIAIRVAIVTVSTTMSSHTPFGCKHYCDYHFS